MNSIQVTAFIPARYYSTRLPYKVLHKFDNKSMLQWVYETTSKAKGIDEVVIVTDHELVFKEAQTFGARVIMTSDKHQSGTDRIAEAASNFPETEVFINVQGDQPFIEPAMIEKLIEPYLNSLKPDMATLSCPLKHTELKNPNTVKVAVNKQNRAMFFTRSPIPYFRNSVKKVPVYQHIGLYAYTAESLKRISGLNSSALELAEGLEQMRALEEGLSIYVSTVNQSIPEINTLEDIHHAIEMNLINNYTLFKEK